MGEVSEKKTHYWSDTRTLYVVLQGEFALYQQVTNDAISDTLRIVAPYVPGHVYKAGPWLSDWKDPKTDLPCCKLALRHAFGDRKQGGKHHSRAIPEDNTDIFVQLGREQPCPDGARLNILAPMPLAILPGLIETTPSVFVKVTEQDGSFTYPPVAPKPTVVPILVYKWYTGCPPDLWDERSGYTWPCGGPSEYLQSIQIYASSPCEEDECDGEEHAKTAFCEASKLLGVTAEIDWKDTIPSLFKKIFATPPAGLSWAQVNLFLWQVQAFQDPSDPLLKQDDPWDISDTSPLQLPFDRERLLISDSGNCGPVGGGSGGSGH